MPIALDPQETRLFWLDRDKDKPLSTRPVFECRAFSRKKRIEYQRLRDEIAELKDATRENDQRFDDLIKKSIEMGVVGWRNFGKEYSFDNLEDTLTDLELIELHAGWPTAFEITDKDRKNSQSLLQSDAENSAKDAPADATTTNGQA